MGPRRPTLQQDKVLRQHEILEPEAPVGPPEATRVPRPREEIGTCLGAITGQLQEDNWYVIDSPGGRSLRESREKGDPFFDKLSL